MALEITNVSKRFDDFVALDNINLTVGEHEFVCLLGPSGCGKTTLLRIIAGLLDMGGGQLVFSGRDLTAVPAGERGFGFRTEERLVGKGCGRPWRSWGGPYP